MVVKLNFEMQWAWNLIRYFDSLDKDISNFKPFMIDAVDEIQKASNENFATKWAKLNNKRAPLSQTTLNARKSRSWYYKQAPNNPWILRRTWKLQENTKKTATEKDWIFEFLQDYAKYHQTWKGRMKRPLFEFTAEVNAEISRRMQEFLRTQIKDNNFI